ncbi:MAG TPA: alpha/beta family hydrolase [Marinobacter sp.]|nr:alpha/beta family hydrolase [Marinobacter sp.]
MTAIKLIENKPAHRNRNEKKSCLVLAHGAGSPADSAFMEQLSGCLASAGIATARFEFPYMQLTRQDGRKRPPDRQPVLLAHFRDVIRQVAGNGPVFIGGKSMGGRMASLLAAEDGLAGILNGCICFGYPFHAAGKPDRWRVEHFDSFRCPVMIVQGTRDPFGKQEELENLNLLSTSSCRIHWLKGANHDFRPLVRQPETQYQLIESAAQVAAEFMAEVC